MRKRDGELSLAPTDLSNHLNCQHLTRLELRVNAGELSRPGVHSPVLEALRDKGIAHEKAYLAHLRTQYFSVVDLGEHATPEQTLEAMRGGAQVIYQGNLTFGRWSGYADFLIKTDRPSELGDWSYEAHDTKLAQETRAGTILQLSVYSALLEYVQGTRPEFMHVVSPRRDWRPQSYRVNDFAAYFRLLHGGLEHFVDAPDDTYPEPVTQCDLCNWYNDCEKRRRGDDHLAYVAGISAGQIQTLRSAGINSLAALARTSHLPRPTRGSLAALQRVQTQAHMQWRGREEGRNVFELKAPVDAEHGFLRLPEPTPDDIFLDFEGNHFAEAGPQEYLTGWVTLDSQGAYQYHHIWAETLAQEKAAFEQFIDTVMAVRARNPQAHIYHFAPYEPAALKRLMGRYATRERELDILLIEQVFVDLHAVVRRTLVASVESYSIKALECFFGYERAQDLREAGMSRRFIEAALELGPLDEEAEAHRTVVTDYNREDCESTHRLQVWLEALRAEYESAHGPLPRPRGDATPTKPPAELDVRLMDVRDRLIGDLSNEREQRSDAEQARYLLGHIMEFHRREDKASWWEYFRLRDLLPEDLLEERKGIAGLVFEEIIDDTAAPLVRYRFAAQEMDARDGEGVKLPDGSGLGRVHAVDHLAHTIDIKHSKASADSRPTEVYLHTHIGTDVIREALMRLGEHVIAHGLDAVAPFACGLKLLTQQAPAALQDASEPTAQDPVARACELALALNNDVLAIQGPPGTGKTYTGAHMICALVRAGRKVGVVAVGHTVVHNLLEKVADTAAEASQTLRIAHRSASASDKGYYTGSRDIANVSSYDYVRSSLADGQTDVLGGTQWMWARPDFRDSVDVLVVDEAGQMSLANVLASAQAARNLVLLGDPQQLEQPIQSTHPEGSEVAALRHWLGPHDTMPAEAGLFLDVTWRLHPDICTFTSKVYYEDRLRARPGLELQAVNDAGDLSGSGLRFVPVVHEGNSARALEEVAEIEALVRRLTEDGVTWTSMNDTTRQLTPADILIVAPYNAQVAALNARLPQMAGRIGTVDRFQGQEAVVVIYSMTSSSAEDAPRGMEFLYNPNRFNVATSRARALCLLVGAPGLLQPTCRTVAQMRMANGFCWFGEMAQT